MTPTQAKPEHTPTPWSLTNTGLIMAPDGRHSIHSCIDNVGISNEDAAFIVRAVNSHQTMLQALKAALVTLGDDAIYAGVQETFDTVQKAIAAASKAEGESND